MIKGIAEKNEQNDFHPTQATLNKMSKNGYMVIYSNRQEGLVSFFNRPYPKNKGSLYEQAGSSDNVLRITFFLSVVECIQSEMSWSP